MASFNKIPLAKFNHKKYKTPRIFKFIKMKVIDDLKFTTINSEVKKGSKQGQYYSY